MWKSEKIGVSAKRIWEGLGINSWEFSGIPKEFASNYYPKKIPLQTERDLKSIFLFYGENQFVFAFFFREIINENNTVVLNVSFQDFFR